MATTLLHSVTMVAAGVLFASCSSVGRTPEATQAASAPAAARTLSMAIRYEPTTLALKVSALAGGDFVKRPFNASLACVDGAGNPQPHLGQSLPELNTDSWQVFPDGQMRTTHRLRPGITWHDGQALTAEDFVFAWRVYSSPALGVFSPKPQDQMIEVSAPDPLTISIHWSSPYPDASALTESRDGSLEPLPRHLLERAFAEVTDDPVARDSFLNLPFWTSDYIGAGPYRLDRWEPGTALQATAFEGYVLGRPRIERVIIRLVADENIMLTNLLAGEIDIATRFTLRFEHAQVLKREWATSGRDGVIQWGAAGIHPIIFQFRADYARRPELLDVRVRRALFHAVDRQALLESLAEGEGRIPDTFIPPEETYYAEVDRAISKYAFDLRRSEQLMREVGLFKDREGWLSAPGGERFQPDYQTLAGTVFERGQAIVAEIWRRAGIDAKTSVLPAAQVRDNQVRQTFPAIATVGTGSPDMFPTGQIGSPANRWAGQNRGGWSNAEYDRLWDVYNTTLRRSDRQQQMVQMMRILSEEVPGFPLYHNYQPTFAFLRNISGPDVGVPGTTAFWNLHLWEVLG